MFTQCPECHAIFQLTAEQLKAANGDVRCGQCLSVFNALNHLSESLPNAKDSADQADDEFEQDLVWDEPAAETAEAVEAHTETPATSEADSDVFSEVVAEANSHTIPKEEIDRFEEFLDTDTPVEAPSESPQPTESAPPTEGPLSAADFLPTQAPAPTTSSFAAEETVVEDQAVEDGLVEDSIDEDDADDTALVDTIAEADSPSADIDLDIAEVFASEEAVIIDDNDFNATPDDAILVDNDEAPIAAEPSHSLDALRMATESLAQKSSQPVPDQLDEGTPSESFTELNDELSENEPDETEVVTVDLSAEVDANDEEFAELDAYLHDEGDTPSPSEPAPATEDEQIIISDSDLESATSADYADTPDAVIEPAVASEASAATTEAPAEQQPAPPTESTGLVHVPSVLLDDLHAAREAQLRKPNTQWIIGSVVLMLTLVLQVAYFNRDELAKDPSLRPWLVSMCNILDCTVSQPYDIKQIEIIGRDVRSHPTARKALIVSTSIINNAEFVQPYPLLLMTFSDMTGSLVAQRRFTPREYLSNSEDIEAGMRPNLPVRIELELVDPGKNAVNYEFRAEQDPRQTRPLS